MGTKEQENGVVILDWVNLNPINSGAGWAKLVVDFLD
jgi:hypothetical protein